MNMYKASESLGVLRRIVEAANEAGSKTLTRSQLQDFLQEEVRLAEHTDGRVRPQDGPEGVFERIDWLEAEVQRASDDSRRAGERGRAFASHDFGGTGLAGGGRNAPADDDYSRAFAQYLRGGIDRVDDRAALEAGYQELGDSATRAFGMDAETRAMSSLSGGGGGFTVPEGFWGSVVDGVQAFGGLLRAPVTRLDTDGANDLPIPTGSPAEAGTIVGESEEIGEEDIPFGQRVMKAFTYTSKIVRVPVQLLQASAIDIEGYVGKKLGERIGRALAPHVLTGTGLEQPQGLLTADSVVHGHTASGTDTISRVDLVSLVESVDLGYADAPGAGWVASRGAWADLFAQETADGNQRYPELNQGRLLGKPFFVDVGMPAFGTGAVALAYGDLSAYWLRTVKGVTLLRLSERYAERLQVGFLAFARYDGAVIGGGISSNPVKTMSLA